MVKDGLHGIRVMAGDHDCEGRSCNRNPAANPSAADFPLPRSAVTRSVEGPWEWAVSRWFVPLRSVLSGAIDCKGYI